MAPLAMTQLAKRIDLNCDLGEASTPEQLDIETLVLPHITSVNIACGFHAGHPDVMRRTIQLALEHDLDIGAHPGFRDPRHAGRREQMRSPTEIENLVAHQVGALAGIAALEGARLSHVKPHGALYNMAARDPTTAQAVARAIATLDRRLILVGLAGSELILAGKAAGLTVAEEAFADRAYHQDGTLVSRERPDAVLQDERAVVVRVLQLVQGKPVPSIDGPPIKVRADTICLHGDTPGADSLARAIRQALDSVGVSLVRLAHA